MTKIIKPKRAWGRDFAEDKRDKKYPMKVDLARAVPASKFWPNKGWHGDQGPNPSCVGYGWAHWLHAAPIRQYLVPEGIYTIAQYLDEWEGEDYGGTSVRAGAKMLQKLGAITSYEWTWSSDTLRSHILSSGPVVIGVNWHRGMNDIGDDGMMSATGAVLGGHCVCLVGYNSKNETFRVKNSYGTSWGQDGYGNLPFSDMQILLDANGEACVGKEAKPKPEGV